MVEFQKAQWDFGEMVFWKEQSVARLAQERARLQWKKLDFSISSQLVLLFAYI